MKLRLLFSLIFGALLTTGFSQSVGIIGSATPTGWDSDTDMVQNPDSTNLWSIVIQLTEGAVKFRQDNAWDVNWGAADFPVGIGTQGGADIPIPAAGEFTVTFNSTTGAYKFSVTSDIGIIGSATPGGWDEDTNMFPDTLDANKYSIRLKLTLGAAKFRANDGWDVNWGALDFPSGVGTQGGPDIPINTAGKYDITFDKSTGEYTFTEVVEFNTISIIGDATPGGWDADTYLTKDAADPNVWKTTLVLNNGAAKFRANSAWTLNWGGDDFPSGIGVPGGNNIPIDSGEYLVVFNTSTLAYNFYPIFASVGIIGDATPGGWDVETAMTQDPNDRSIWRLRKILTDGELQFRANNAWDVFWGSGDFPTGTATLEGPPVPIPAGEYKITFNSATGVYSFEELIIFSSVGLVGTATPLMQWNMDDVQMTKDLVDESFWYIPSVDLFDGEAKFRAENAWTVNWGAAQFPTGIGTQGGANILVTAGTYRVTLNTATGEYAFGAPSSTTNLLNDSAISISPNPAKDVLNISVDAQELKGETRVILFNNMGQQVLTTTVNVQNRVSIPVGSLMPGQYTVHMSNGKYIVGKKVVIVK